MKRLVLLGEGQGEVLGLPVLARKLLQEKDADGRFFLDYEVIRAHNAAGLVKWDKEQNRNDYTAWLKYLGYARRRSNLGAVLTVLDGDDKTFPAGTKTLFCPASA